MPNAHSYTEWMRDLEETAPEERSDFIYASLKSKHMLHIFGRYFFPQQIAEGMTTAPFHLEMLAEIAKPTDSVIIEPREHAKTTWARIDTLHDIVYEHEPFIVFVGVTLTDAKASFSYVKGQLESNELLRGVYGNLVPPIDIYQRTPWKDNHFETTNGIVCIARGGGKGRGLNIGGRRPSKVIIDDMEEDDKVRSQVQRKKLEHWFFNVLIPSIDSQRGKFKMIGTVLHYDALVLKAYKQFGGVRRGALEDENGKPSLEGEPIWPDWWTKEKLKKRRDTMGTFAFAQEYLNEPMSDDNADVKLDWIRRIDGVKLHDKHNKLLWKICTALDPAISIKSTADESAWVTVGRNLESEDIDIVVMGVDHGRFGVSSIADKSRQIFERYPHDKFLVETVAYQEALRQILAEREVPAKAYNPRSKDKRSRLQTIVGLIESGKIKFMPNCEDLITQLIQFPNTDEDDIVDAFVMAVHGVLGTGGEFKMVTL